MKTENQKPQNRKILLFLLVVVLVISASSCITGKYIQRYWDNTKSEQRLREQYYRGIYDVCIQTDLTVTECRNLVRDVSSQVDPFYRKSLDWVWPLE